MLKEKITYTVIIVFIIDISNLINKTGFCL